MSPTHPLLLWGVQYYPERVGVGTGFYSSLAKATAESTESQNWLIKGLGTGVARPR